MPSTLFLGGARSGKSRLAQDAAEACEDPLLFLATAEPLDGEMEARIARHQADRGPRWRTVDCPLDLPTALRDTRAKAGAIVVDCLTLWLSNLMLGGHDVKSAVDDLLAAIREGHTHLFIVSNEVGMGIVPEHPLGRSFRDEAGRLNQLVAHSVDKSVLVVAGLRLPLST